MSIFDLMATPFAECIILVAIHTYLGIHVLRRRVIFVDLALAQTAALGSTVGFLFGIMPHTSAGFIFSMAFTFVGAAIFAITRIKGEKIPQEAIIGLFYAITAAMAVLVVQKTQGAEHMEDILVGRILWVKWSDVISALIAYAFIGVVHYIFRRQFLLISENPDLAYEKGMNVRAWDFLFYLTFGFVITFSVHVAGVLLVFVFLVAPAIMAMMITDNLKHQLVIGWSMGTIVTVIGLYLSYAIDLPSGPTVVSFYGVILAIGAVIFYISRAVDRARAFGWVGVGILVIAAIAFIFVNSAKWLAQTSLAADEELAHGAAEMRRDEMTAETHQLEHHATNREITEVMELTCKGITPRQAKRYTSCLDSSEKLDFIQAEIKRDKEGACWMLVPFLSDGETSEFFRSEAVDLAKTALGKDFGYDPEQEPDSEQNIKAVEAMRAALKAYSEDHDHEHAGEEGMGRATGPRDGSGRGRTTGRGLGIGPRDGTGKGSGTGIGPRDGTGKGLGRGLRQGPKDGRGRGGRRGSE